MHYFAAVIVPPGGDLDELVEAIMAPYDEEENADGGFWDWWQIGGRYTGVWSEHDPREDPANWEVCYMCGGTGLRNDVAGREHRLSNPDYDCNGCGLRKPDDSTQRPVGMKVKWPSSWARCDADVLTVAQYRNVVAAGHPPFSVITPLAACHREVWDGKDWVETGDWQKVALAAVDGYDDHRVVVVDYHN